MYFFFVVAFVSNQFSKSMKILFLNRASIQMTIINYFLTLGDIIEMICFCFCILLNKPFNFGLRILQSEHINNHQYKRNPMLIELFHSNLLLCFKSLLWMDLLRKKINYMVHLCRSTRLGHLCKPEWNWLIAKYEETCVI